MRLVKTLMSLMGVTKQQAEFKDARLGTFSRRRDLGWKGAVVIGETRVEVILGSNGEPPSESVLESACEIIREWDSIRTELLEFAKAQFKTPLWRTEMNLPDPETWTLRSIQILWSDKPRFAFVYFVVANDDRDWFVTVSDKKPIELSYDH